MPSLTGRTDTWLVLSEQLAGADKGKTAQAVGVTAVRF